MKNKKIFFIIPIILILIGGTIFFCFIFNKKTLTEEEKYEEKMKITDISSRIIPKEITVIVNYEPSKDPKEYIENIDEVRDILNDKLLGIDFSNVDFSTSGSYGYILKYGDNEIMGVVKVFENAEKLQEYLDLEKGKVQIIQNENVEDGLIRDSLSDEYINNGNDITTINENNETITYKNKTRTNLLKSTNTKITQYWYYYEPKNFIATKENGYDLTNYNGELWYKFEYPLYPENNIPVAFSNWLTNIREDGILEKLFYNKAKEYFGEDRVFCYKNPQILYAANNENQIVGLIAMGTIGIEDEYASCSKELKTVYLNSKNILQLDEYNETFIEKE